jgi:hypothetical protein
MRKINTQAPMLLMAAILILTQAGTLRADVTSGPAATPAADTNQVSVVNNTPFDFDGDGRTDISVWRESSGTWLIIRSSDGLLSMPVLGASGDVLVPADYDGDGRTDIAAWRPSTGQWFIIESSTGSLRTPAPEFGASDDVPVPSAYVR